MNDTSILIVEDEGIVAEDLACKIRQFGYDVAGTADTGEEAIKLARLQQPDLVLMDIHLNGAMDGIEAARQIHEECNLPILFLTAHSDLGTAQRIQQAHAVGYILKPIDDRDLHIQIDMALQKNRAEKRLRESEERYRLLAETMQQGVVHQDATGRIIAMNQAARRILGRTQEQFLGSSSVAVEHHTIRENGKFFPGLEHPSMVALRTGKVVRNVIMGMFNPELHQYRWINIDAVPVLFDEKTEPMEVYTVFEDITERKQSEEAQARLAAIVTSADDAIIGMDLDNNIQTWNAGAENVFGYKADEIIGKNIDLLLPPGHQDEIHTIQNKLASDRVIRKFESLSQQKDGTVIPVSLAVSHIRDGTGKVIGTSRIAHNITEHKRFEAERDAMIECLRFINESSETRGLIHSAISFFQKLSDCEAVGVRLKKDDDYPYYETLGFSDAFLTAGNGLCSHDTSRERNHNEAGNPMYACLCGDVLSTSIDKTRTFLTVRGSFWCNSATELLTVIPESDLPNLSCRCCISEGYESMALIPFIVGVKRLGLLQLNDRKKNRFTEQAITLWERFANHLAVALAKFQADEALAALNAELDLKVRQRTFELQKMQQLYLHSEKLAAIGKLSASIAHEFNNPLQGILSILGGVKKRAIMEAEDAELVDIAIGEGKRISYLIRSLQDFNRPTSGIIATVDVHQSLDSIMLLHKNDFTQKRITMKTDYAPDLPTIGAVSDQIKQVFLNLLTNAADACQNRGGIITVSTRQEDDKVAIAIKDNGVGIRSEDIDNIYRPFYTTKPEVKGIGLGLSISYGIVKKHKGEIRIESTPGKGSTFTVVLPIKNDQVEFFPAPDRS